MRTFCRRTLFSIASVDCRARSSSRTGAELPTLAANNNPTPSRADVRAFQGLNTAGKRRHKDRKLPTQVAAILSGAARQSCESLERLLLHSTSSQLAAV